MNHFNGAFAKAFPERTAANIERVRQQEAALIAHDPMRIDEESDVLVKRAHPKFSVGQVVVERGYRKRAGKITGITDSGALEIRFSACVTGIYLLDQVEAA